MYKCVNIYVFDITVNMFYDYIREDIYSCFVWVNKCTFVVIYKDMCSRDLFVYLSLFNSYCDFIYVWLYLLV